MKNEGIEEWFLRLTKHFHKSGMEDVIYFQIRPANSKLRKTSLEALDGRGTFHYSF